MLAGLYLAAAPIFVAALHARLQRLLWLRYRPATLCSGSCSPVSGSSTAFSSAANSASAYSQSHDNYVNDPTLCSSSNLIVFNVSATPYCLFTQDSRVPHEPACAKSMREVNLVLWQEVLGDFPERTLTKKDDLDWLEVQFGEANLADQGRAESSVKEPFMSRSKANVLLGADKRYQSLDVYLQPENTTFPENSKPIRVDTLFEDTLERASKHMTNNGACSSQLLAVVSSDLKQCIGVFAFTYCLHPPLAGVCLLHVCYHAEGGGRWVGGKPER